MASSSEEGAENGGEWMTSPEREQEDGAGESSRFNQRPRDSVDPRSSSFSDTPD